MIAVKSAIFVAFLVALQILISTTNAQIINGVDKCEDHSGIAQFMPNPAMMITFSPAMGTFTGRFKEGSWAPDLPFLEISPYIVDTHISLVGYLGHVPPLCYNLIDFSPRTGHLWITNNPVDDSVFGWARTSSVRVYFWCTDYFQIGSTQSPMIGTFSDRNMHIYNLEIDCLSYCSLQPITYSDPVFPDMTALKDTPTTVPIGSFSHKTVVSSDQYPCTINYKITCFAGCTTPPLHTFTADSIIWNADTDGTFLMELKVFYDQYEGLDETGNFVQLFELTVASCYGSPIIQNSGAPSIFLNYFTDEDVHLIEAFTGGHDSDPVLCELAFTLYQDQAEPVVTFDETSLQITIKSSDETFIGQSTRFLLEVSYKNYPLETSVQYEYEFDVDILSICTRDPLQQTDLALTEIFVETEVDTPMYYSLTSMWTNPGILNSPIDCKLKYWIDPITSYSFLQKEGIEPQITLNPTDWADVGVWNTQLVVIFLRYQTISIPNPPATIPIRAKVTPNCREQVSWVVKQNSIYTHMNSYKYISIEATSVAIVNAPDDCILTLAVDVTTLPTWVDQSMFTFESLTSVATFKMTVTTDGSSITDYASIGNFAMVLLGQYDGFADFDPLSATTQAQNSIQIYVEPICAEVSTYSAQDVVNIYPKYQYIVGETAFGISFEFDMDPTGCYIDQKFTIKVDGVEGETDIFTLDQVNGLILVETSDLSYKDESFLVTITGFLQTLPDDTQSFDDLNYHVFIVEYYDPCLYGIFERSPDQVLPDIEYTIYDGTPYTEPLSPFYLNETSCTYNIEYEFYIGNPTLISFDNNAMDFIVQTTSINDVGLYQIQLILRLENAYPFNQFIYKELSFQVEIVSSCNTATMAFIDSSASAISKVYFLGGTDISIDATSDIELLDSFGIPLILPCGPLVIQSVSLNKQIGYKIDATSQIVNNEIECCGTSNTNDYGLYNLEFSTTLSEYPSYTPQILRYEVEIIPDCSLYTVYIKSGYSVPFQISAQIGAQFGLQGSLDLSNVFTHQFIGHYGNYCGDLVVNLPTSTTISYPYLSTMFPSGVITSLPYDISHRSDTGDITLIEVYLQNFGLQDGGQNFQLQTQVLLYCELSTLESFQPASFQYEINNSADITVDMTFNNLIWTSNSWLPECDTERVDELHFSFEGRAIDERAGFFIYVDSQTSILQSTSPGDEGLYEINVWLKTYLPSQTYAYSTKNTTISIEMIYDPCYTSHIQDEEFSEWIYDWQYEISPLNGLNYTSYDLPYFTNDVSRFTPGFHCGDIEYSLDTSATWLEDLTTGGVEQYRTNGGVEIMPQYVSEQKLIMYAIDFRAVKLHALHNEQYNFTLRVKMLDYPGVPEVVKTISLTIKSACEFTELTLLIDVEDENFQKSWYKQGSDLHLLYQIGQPAFEFEALVADTVSLQSPFEDLEPFCGNRNFELTCSDQYANDTLRLVDSSVIQTISTEPGGLLIPSLTSTTTEIYPTLSLLTNEMQIVNEDFNQVLGYYGNHILDDDPSLLVQTFSADLTARVDLPTIIAPDNTKSFTINVYIVNQCDKVFLYKEESTDKITIGVQQEAKTLTIGSYTSYLDHVIYTSYGFSKVENQPLCGIPQVELQCMIPGAVATSISSVQDIDLSLFTEEFSTSLNDPANFFVVIPEFLQVSYQADGSTNVAAEALEDIWDPAPYVCLIKANINPPSQIAVPNDFLVVNVLPLDYASINESPEIIGLDSEYTVKYGGEVADSFTFNDNDILDIGQLKATVEVTGTEITEDCGCVSFEAQYQTSEGDIGTEKSLGAALSKNKKLQSISVQFYAIPTQEMINKRYELTITLSDTFASVQKNLVIITEGTEVEEISEEESGSEEFKFAGVIIENEDKKQIELKEEEDKLENLKDFLSQNSEIFRGGSNPTAAQFANVKTTLKQSDLPIPYVKSVDTNGLVQIYISQEILLPNKNDMEAFVRHITYLYAIEITIEAQDLVILGQPQIASQYTEVPQTNRTLQEDYKNGKYLTDWSVYTEHRFKDFSSPNDENEEIIFDSKRFKWSITDIQEQGMTVQLEFEKPAMISTYGNDVMNFYAILPESFLTRPAELFAGEQDWGDIRLRDRRNIPEQNAVSLLSSEAGSVGLQVITIVNVVLASFMQMSLDELWLVLNSLSFIVYLPLFTFIYPENCQTLMKSFLAVVTFDLIETLETFGVDVIPWEFSETPPFNENFEELGYENSNTVSLLGTVNILIFFMTMILLLATCIKFCNPCHGTRFGRYVRRKFTFRGQLSTLNQLVISGSIELLVCSIVNVVPSTFDSPILTEQDWSELGTNDRIALVYGIVILALFSLMVIIYFLMLSYMAPKLFFLAQQEDFKVFFISRITAYRAALNDIEQKRLSQQKSEDIEPKDSEVKVKESYDQQKGDQLGLDTFMTSPDKSLQTSQNLLLKDQQSSMMLTSNLKDYSSIMALNENQSDDKTLLQLGIEEKVDPKEAKQNIDKLALQAAGMAIRIGKPKEVPEELSMSFEVEAEKQSIVDEEIKSQKQIDDINQEIAEAKNYELQKKNFSFKYLYATVINYSEADLIIRIDQLVEINRLQQKRGRKYGKLTRFQKQLKYYFGGILDGIDQRNIQNFFYLPLYLARRIIFVFTAIYLSEVPQIQMMLTYHLCLLMLAILAGSQPHKSQVKNRLETFNETVVLILLMLSWMMLIIIMQVIDPEEAQDLYNNFGLVFSFLLLTCIVLNFLRIVCQMCSKAQKNYAKKLRISMSKAAQYDKLMNFVPGFKQCDCTCYSCSNAGYIGKLNQRQECWDPVQPRWFKIRPIECPYDEEKSWMNFFTTKQEIQIKQESKAVKIGQKLLRQNKIDRIEEEPKDEMEGIELEFQRINQEPVNKKKVRFALTTDEEAYQKAQVVQKVVVKKVRFSDDLPLQEVETAENNNLQETNEPIKLVSLQSNYDNDQNEDYEDKEDIPAVIQDLDSKMRELQRKDHARVHKTKQMRHRLWVNEDSFSFEKSKTKTKQAKLRQTTTVSQEVDTLLSHVDQNKETSQQLQYGESLAKHIKSKKKRNIFSRKTLV